MAQLVACASVIAAVVLLADYLQQVKVGSFPSASTPKTTGVAGEVITAGGAKVNFSDFDTDKDGAIEIAEVPAALRALGIPDTDATAREVIKKADASGDSVVTVSEFQALVSAIEGEQPLLPWWAYLLIMAGVIGIALLVAYFAWKKGNWMTLLVAAVVGSSTIAALEGFLYGSPVLGGYMVLASIGALALFLVARWTKRTFIDPVAKRLGDAVEAVQGMRESARDMHKSATEYIGSLSAKAILKGTVDTIAGAGTKVAETTQAVIGKSVNAGMRGLAIVADAADAVEHGGEKPKTVAEEKGGNLKAVEAGQGFHLPALPKIGFTSGAGTPTTNFFTPPGEALPMDGSGRSLGASFRSAQGSSRSVGE